jgi:phosphoglycerol geranylgeranyltransferase
MQTKWKNWVHVTKLDPDKSLTDAQIEQVVTSGTDAVMLSGTLNVTQANLARLLAQVARSGIPLVVEPASPEVARFDGIDLVYVPSVLNSTDVNWIVGKHKDWVQQYRVDWKKVVPEAYIVLNPASSVGKVTKALCSLTPEEAAAYARLADRYFDFPIVYIEYSGIYGDPNVVKAVSSTVEDAVLYYGGGIDSPERAAEMAALVDTIVVGNAVYSRGPDLLKATVKAVQ